MGNYNSSLPAFKKFDPSASFPYSTNILKQVKSGYLYQYYEKPISSQLYLHYRLGDIALFSGRDLINIFNIDESYSDKIYAS